MIFLEMDFFYLIQCITEIEDLAWGVSGFGCFNFALMPEFRNDSSVNWDNLLIPLNFKESTSLDAFSISIIGDILSLSLTKIWEECEKLQKL